MPEPASADGEPQSAEARDRMNASGAILAFDFGDERIGVALGDATIGIAHPLATIAFADNARRFEAINRLVEEWRPARIVVGLPGASSGGEHPLAARVRRFRERLRSRFGLPVDLVDEHLSSWEASGRMSRAGVRTSDQKPYIDQLAACVILESWFEANAATPGSVAVST